MLSGPHRPALLFGLLQKHQRFWGVDVYGGLQNPASSSPACGAGSTSAVDAPFEVALEPRQGRRSGQVLLNGMELDSARVCVVCVVCVCVCAFSSVPLAQEARQVGGLDWLGTCSSASRG